MNIIIVDLVLVFIYLVVQRLRRPDIYLHAKTHLLYHRSCRVTENCII